MIEKKLKTSKWNEKWNLNCERSNMYIILASTEIFGGDIC